MPDNLATAILRDKSRRMVLTEVAPELASQLLERNKRNRPLKEATVQRYSKELREGLWRSTAQPIVVDWDGNLLDGQHRLWACVATGISLVSYIAFGEDPDTFAVYDRGSTRTAGDVLALLGHRDYNVLGATAAKLHRHRRGVTWTRTAIERYVSPQEAAQIVEEFPSLAHSVSVTRCVRSLMPGSLAAFCHHLFAEVDPEAADRFFNEVGTGASLKETDSTYLLRDRLLRDRLDPRRRMDEKEMAALIIKAWNYRGRTMRFLRWRQAEPRPEAFPEIE